MDKEKLAAGIEKLDDESFKALDEAIAKRRGKKAGGGDDDLRETVLALQKQIAEIAAGREVKPAKKEKVEKTDEEGALAGFFNEVFGKWA